MTADDSQDFIKNCSCTHPFREQFGGNCRGFVLG